MRTDNYGSDKFVLIAGLTHNIILCISYFITRIRLTKEYLVGCLLAMYNKLHVMGNKICKYVYCKKNIMVTILCMEFNINNDLIKSMIVIQKVWKMSERQRVL